MKSHIAAFVAASFVVSGCTVGPDYAAPNMQLPATFLNAGSAELVNAAAEQWWRALNDPTLNQLIERGLDQNLDMEISFERIRAAQAAVSRSGLNSQISGDLRAQAQVSENNPGNKVEATSVRLNANYVFDLFGGVRRGREQALANFEASQFRAGTVRLAYLSDIVNNYVQARYYQRAASITRSTIQSRRKTLSLTNRRREAGEATELEVQQARSQLRSAEASLPILEANFEVSVFRIATLLAEPAGPLMMQMKDGGKQPIPKTMGKVGVPADLLRNRPDVRTAERNVAAATAAIGVAEAELYPSLVLGGTVTDSTRDNWTFGPTLNFPLLSRGILKANKKIAISQAREAELTWRQSVLRAVEDVQINQSLTKHWYKQLSLNRQASRASAQVLSLSRDSYQGGAITLTDVLDAERANANDKMAIAAACRDFALSWARLQVAVGRGWYEGDPFPVIDDNTPPVEVAQATSE